MKYEYVEHNGGVWRMSKHQFERLVHTIANGDEYDMDNFGKMVSGEIKHTRDYSSVEYGRGRKS